ncbi:MAG: hypothetical protein ACQXXE_05830 [Candidatus Bathyarchaeia archaeon]|jgi:hypothetical protein|nr:hypothetical protein [Candidatus Bathyarchaeota archaeon A05DMB-5]
MTKTSLSSIVAINLLIVLGLFSVSSLNLGYGASENVNANPQLVYWPPTEVWTWLDQLFIYCPRVDAHSIAWGPSGESLLIYGGGSLLSVNTSSGQLINKLSNFHIDGATYFNRFAISTDESKIFFVNFSVPHSGVFSVNLDGSGLTQIAEVNSSSSCSPAAIDLSRDGAFLVYSEYFINYTQPAPYHSNIWKVDLGSMEKSLVVRLSENDSGSAMITSVRVSPANDKLAFTTCRDVYIVNLDGADLTKVTSVADNTIAAWIDWSHNGTMLMFSELNGQSGEFAPETRWLYEWGSNIAVVDVDGGNKHVIYNVGYAGMWSPIDDSLIAFINLKAHAPYLLRLGKPIDAAPDSDGDGLDDYTEISSTFLNPGDPTDLYEDYDNDGLTNLEEINLLTAMNLPDTDHDGLSDGVEVKVFRTDPLKADTDGDGVSDGLEAAATGLSAFVSVLPEGWIRMQLEWSNKTMYVTTNSSVLGVVFNSTSMALSISVGGPDGTTGIANITIPIEMVSSLSAVKVTLDNHPIDFQINKIGNNAQIYVEYHHSFHELTAHLQGGGMGGVDLTDLMSYWWLILSVAIVAIAAVIAVIIVKHR